MRDRGFLDNYKYVFDPDGAYGGNQKAPRLDPSKYASIVRKHFPDHTDEQVSKCLDLIETEGCGYVALINTVFLRFYGEEEKFRQIFRYPMFTEDGKLNFNDLIVDFYCATDNHNRQFIFDTVSYTEDRDYPNGYGTTTDSREWRFESYMRNHNVRVDVRDIIIFPKHVDLQLRDGPIIAGVRPMAMYDKDGNVTDNSQGGHAVIVTGKGDNGLIRVSSWGQECYIKPGTYKMHENYQQVIYKN